MKMLRTALALLAFTCASMRFATPASGQGPDAPARVWFDDEIVVTYAARVEGGWLVVEVNHEAGWHTYAMDNVERAREKSDKETPDTELPTVITLPDGVTLAGGWRQSQPEDLSDAAIRWYTWGFEGRSFFAAPLGGARPPASVTVDGQACTRDLCAMIDGLGVPVVPESSGAAPTVDPHTLVEVARP